MKAYLITSKAGRMVAGQTNNGVGTTIFLTDRQAEFELAQGTILPKPDENAAPAPDAEAAAEPQIDLAAMTVAALIAFAAEKGIEVDAKAKKADLIAAIEDGLLLAAVKAGLVQKAETAAEPGQNGA